ncbi:MAG: hypothetical protein IVW55_12950 [Chloroflexi bacterium]|nr:hypothetical protein [Chloroflexota bacterium]
MTVASIQPVAAIGIGSNSTRLLVAVRAHSEMGTRIMATERLETVTRLASYEPGVPPVLGASAIRATLAAAFDYAHYATERGAALLGIVATEAVRAASNSSKLRDDLERALGLEVTVLSGSEEADLGWQAVSSSYSWLNRQLGVIDIGGGSTDLSVGWGGGAHPLTVASVGIGARELIRRFDLGQAVEPYKLVEALSMLLLELSPQAMSLQPYPEACVLIGGLAQVLAVIYRDPGGGRLLAEDAPLTRDWLQQWLERLSAGDAKERHVLGIPAERTDTALAGAIILLSLLNAWQLEQFYVSQRNILDGFIQQSMHAPTSL